MSVRRVAFVLLALCWLVPTTAQAQCSLAWNNLSFGTYLGAVSNGVNTGSVSCAVGQNYTIGLNAGLGLGATETVRKMTGPLASTLNYQLFLDSARTTNWGNTTGNEYTGTGNGGSQTITVYSQIPAGQYVIPGTYTDTISSSTSSFQVTAIVQATCTLSATALAFGTYTGVVLNSTSTVTITCTKNTTYNVGLNAGTASGATVTTRKMTGPSSATLSYSLFRDSARTLNWGNTVGTNTAAGSGNGIAQSLIVYGQMAAGQTGKPPGSYSDTITATITY